MAVDGDIEGDVTSCGGDLTVGGSVSGDFGALQSHIGSAGSGNGGEIRIDGDYDGDLSGVETVIVSGDINGDVKGAQSVRAEGDVNGDITAENVTVCGGVDGDVSSGGGSVSIGGDLEGDLTAGG